MDPTNKASDLLTLTPETSPDEATARAIEAGLDAYMTRSRLTTI